MFVQTPARPKNPPPTRGNAALGQIEFLLSNLWARWWTSGPGPPKSGRLDQDFSLWARKKLVARPDFEPTRTRSGPGDPDQIYSGPDRVFLVQIENRPGPEKIRPGPEKIDPDQRKSDPDQRKSDLGQVQNSSGPDDPVHSGPDFSGTRTRSGLRSRPGPMSG